jgi:hypothetical protein|tara:strand:+ start:43 stop:372 length:330 start_codon:yes stop_codon:yes gene_type:complete
VLDSQSEQESHQTHNQQSIQKSEQEKAHGQEFNAEPSYNPIQTPKDVLRYGKMNKIHFDPALIDSARQQPDTSKRIDIQQEDFVTKNQASYHNDNETYVQSPGATLNDQ